MLIKKEQIHEKLGNIADEVDEIRDLISDRTLLEYMLDWLKQKPRFKCVMCVDCYTKFQVDSLDLYCKCPSCQRKVKLRGYGPQYSDIEDFIIDVKTWLDNGPEGVLNRHGEKKEE
jgi:hypothetical protein